MSIRRALLVATLALVPSLGFAAGGETKVFLLDSFDGYGIDTCVASGASCGAAMAAAWCRTHDYKRAVRFGRAEGEALVTLASADGRNACYGNSCAATVAITCEK